MKSALWRQRFPKYLELYFKREEFIQLSSKLTNKKFILIVPDQNQHYRRRNRRTHISFEAFATLVKSGFADQARNKELLEAVQQVNSRLE